MHRESEQQRAALKLRERERRDLIQKGLINYGIKDESVLTAMNRVPREWFLDTSLQAQAYDNSALPIAENQTISQPYIVALMAEVLELRKSDRLLEVGTGSGYAAAVFAELVDEVYTIERYESLASHASERLQTLGYDNVFVRVGDGSLGWSEAAPFDAISVAAATEEIPSALLDQLTIGGRLVIPVGRDQAAQELICVTRTAEGFVKKSFGGVRFVPLISDEK